MAGEKTYFGIGLVIGIVITVLFLYYFAPRYTTEKSGDMLIKQDRWSGQSWRFVNNQWKAIMSVDRDWEKIDKTLMEALQIPTDTPKRTNTLEVLRKRDSILEDLTDDELLERIKFVYSKEILVNLYLQNFRKLEVEGKVDQ